MNRWLITAGVSTTLALTFVAGINFVATVNSSRPLVSNLLSSTPGFCAQPTTRQALRVSIRPKPRHNTIQSNQSGRLNGKTPNRQFWDSEGAAEKLMERPQSLAAAKDKPADLQQLSELAADIESAMEDLIEQDLVAVHRDPKSLKVEISSSVLFSSGSSTLSDAGLPVLRSIADVLGATANEIHVEGFTDSQPINTVAYPSNWELSTARATRVVRLFAEYAIEPERMVSIGYGEFRPIADNSTAEGRAKNRRVVVVVKAAQS